VAHRDDPVTRHSLRAPLSLIVGTLTIAGTIVFACKTDTNIGPDAALDSLYVEPATAVIVLDDTLRLRAIGIDRNGRRFADARARWATSDAAISLSATGVAIGLNAGAATVHATVGSKTATAVITVQPKPAFATSRDSVPFNTIANGPTPSTQLVVLTNGGGGTLAPVVNTVTYGPGASGWLNTGLSGLVAPDTLALDVLNTALPVGTYSATVSLTASKATNSPKTIKVTLAVALGAPSTMTADSGDGQAATVNMPVAVPPVVLVRDQYSNAIPGVAVTFTVTGGGGSITPIAPVATDASGRARVTTWTLGTGAGTNTLRASATGLAPVTFTATGVAQTDVSPTQSSVAAATGTITACSSSCVAGSTASTITVTVRDGFSNPIGSAAVTLSSTGTNNTLSPASGTTSAGGTFTATFTSTTAEPKTISAAADGGSGNVPISQTAPVTVNAGAPASVNVVNSGFSARVGTGVGTLPTYTVRDPFSNLVPNFSVSYSSSNSGAFTGPNTTNASGQVTLTSWTMAGTAGLDATGRMPNAVTVTAGSVSGSATDYGIYTYSGDVGPIIGGGSGCDGCHYVSWTRANIVGQPDQDPAGFTACSGYTLVTASDTAASLIYLKTRGTLVSSAAPCGGNMPSSAGLSAATRKIIAAWILNGAPNN